MWNLHSAGLLKTGSAEADALAFARTINFPLPAHDIAHWILMGKWKVGGFSPTESDWDERKTKRELVHARIGDHITSITRT
jgi:hypothetical protein